MFVLSSVLIESIIKNHPFANANKRTAMSSGGLFLLLNGYHLDAPNSGIVEMGEGIAIGKYNLDDIENWLYLWSHEYDSRNLCVNNNIDIKHFLMKTYPL